MVAVLLAQREGQVQARARWRKHLKPPEVVAKKGEFEIGLVKLAKPTQLAGGIHALKANVIADAMLRVEQVDAQRVFLIGVVDDEEQCSRRRCVLCFEPLAMQDLAGFMVVDE